MSIAASEPVTTRPAVAAGVYADLHVHSTASDGVFAPSELIRQARELGLGAIALTDHDTLAGVPEAREAAREAGIELVAGIELSCGWPGQDHSLHVVGLFVDEASAALTTLLDDQKRHRFHRAMEILDRLQSLGFSMDALRERFRASEDRVLGRPHIARYLMEIGAIAEFQEAFEKYLKRGRPAYVQKKHVLPEEGISAIHGAGGMAFIAHPGLISDWNGVWSQIGDLSWDGIEAHYAEHSIEQADFFLDLARRKGWLLTGGSDYHGEYGKHVSRFGLHGLDRSEFATLSAGAVARRTRELAA
ncbi:MAG TPA: PHP domain-containing protein [Candidatus Ozemobacteraceae bacterium]|nr:PHP domain-containing protein [Candidatus Ozemobacteraceae bacterium]